MSDVVVTDEKPENGEDELVEDFLDPWTCVASKTRKGARECTDLYLCDKGSFDISSEIDHFCNIEVLWLEGNKLSGLMKLKNQIRLQELYVSNNHLTNLHGIESCTFLRKLVACSNRLDDLRQQLRFLSRFHFLSELDLSENPCADGKGYRKAVLGTLRTLTSLDNTPVGFSERETREDPASSKTKRRPSLSEIIKASVSETEAFAEAKEIRDKLARREEERETASWGLVTAPIPPSEPPTSQGNLEMQGRRSRRIAAEHRALNPWEVAKLKKILEGKIPDNFTRENCIEVLSTIAGEEGAAGELGRELALGVDRSAGDARVRSLFPTAEASVQSKDFLRVVLEELPWRFMDEGRLRREIDLLYREAKRLRDNEDLKGAREKCLKASRLEGCLSRAKDALMAADPPEPPKSGLEERTAEARLRTKGRLDTFSCSSIMGTEISFGAGEDRMSPAQGQRVKLFDRKRCDRDAIKENLLNIKKIIENRKAKKTKEDEKQRQVPFKMKRFSEVPSRFMEKKSGKIEDVSDSDSQKGGSGVQRKCPQVQSDPNEGPKMHKSFGKVPEYITRRERARLQALLDEQKRLEEAPPGYRYMAEDEQKDILEHLKSRKASLEKEYSALPLRIELRRQQERQKSIEASIEEVEAAIKKFSESEVRLLSRMLQSALS
ncbi:hypothetical protein FOL47_007719 [Perkinsus chesapeaki]|uniref:Enkurin domain-containing protein n=1 Tax=Perkinsus chesapeaki TaxID=330153 RepID=A0A7J6LIK2_PERCH|nr:hypothetical protein FOL47_007719 [Perkinsus chesapeaki]